MILLQTLAQVGVQPHIFGDAFVHFRREYGKGAFAALFGDVHGGVGAADQAVEIVTVFRAQRDANRTTGIDFDKADAEGRFQSIDNTLGQLLQHLAVGLLGQHQEFIAPKTGQNLIGLQTAEHRQRYFNQQTVAEHMPVGVVHLFEIIEIEVHQPNVAVTALRDSLDDFVLNGVAVGQAGDDIGIGQHPQAFLGAAFFGDVRTGTNQEDFVFPATAVDEFVAEQKQPLAFYRFDPAFNLVG
ncbi:hypothetical protein D3C79_261420 [compost metagenome]